MLTAGKQFRKNLICLHVHVVFICDIFLLFCINFDCINRKPICNKNQGIIKIAHRKDAKQFGWHHSERNKWVISTAVGSTAPQIRISALKVLQPRWQYCMSPGAQLLRSYIAGMAGRARGVVHCPNLSAHHFNTYLCAGVVPSGWEAAVKCACGWRTTHEGEVEEVGQNTAAG